MHDEIIKALRQQLATPKGSAAKAAESLGWKRTSQGGFKFYAQKDDEINLLIAALSVRRVMDKYPEIYMDAIELVKETMSDKKERIKDDHQDKQ